MSTTAISGQRGASNVMRLVPVHVCIFRGSGSKRPASSPSWCRPGGGIVPYIGPLFHFDADRSGSWHWNLAHAVLALAPGAIGVLLGLFVVAQAPASRSVMGD